MQRTVFFFLIAAAAWTVSIAADSPKLPEYHRGENLVVAAVGMNPATTSVALTPLAGGSELPVNISNPTASNITITIPAAAAFGDYRVDVKNAAVPVAGPSPSALRVVPEKPVVNTFADKVLFPDPDGSYQLALDAKCPAGATCTLNVQKGCPIAGKVVAGRTTFVLPPSLKGKQRLTLHSSDGADSEPFELVFSRVQESTPKIAAFAAVVITILIVLVLVWVGWKGIQTDINGEHFLFKALFLDKATSTYSLSKCQFLAWTFAAILAYIFLLVSLAFVQGNLTMADIPGGLPGILLVSAGTGVLATGITSAKGDKGAGEPQPMLSDFITTGGVVAAERLQFFVWTLVGIASFLTIVFLNSPATISTLPPVPDGFLQLMGISAAGYLGGKLARKPGPVITSVAVVAQDVKNSGGLTLDLTGTALAQLAEFALDDKPVSREKLLNENGAQGLPEIITKDDQVGESGYAKVLRVRIQAPLTLPAGKHTLTITNPNAERATKEF